MIGTNIFDYIHIEDQQEFAENTGISTSVQQGLSGSFKGSSSSLSSESSYPKHKYDTENLKSSRCLCIDKSKPSLKISILNHCLI